MEPPLLRVLVCGSREWTDHWAVTKRLMALPPKSTVVVGYDPEKKRPKGADEMAYQAATYLGLTVECHPADWDQYGRRAGFVRNLEMFDYPVPELCIAFWDGESPGTKSSLDIARRRAVPSEVHTKEAA